MKAWDRVNRYEIRQESDLTWTAYLPNHDMTVTNFADEESATNFASWLTAEDQ